MLWKMGRSENFDSAAANRSDDRWPPARHSLFINDDKYEIEGRRHGELDLD